MSLSLTDIGAIELGVHPGELAESPDSLLLKLLRGEEPEIIVMASIGNRPVAAAGAIDDAGEIGSLAIGEAPNELSGAGADERILLSDGEWCGRPDDFGAAHLEADARIVQISDYQERIPLYPEEDRRATQFIASLEAANDDGYFADWQYERTVEGQPAALFMAEENGYSRDFVPIARARGKAMRAGLTRAAFEFETIADIFGRAPFCRETWTGKGGSGGDPHLAGRRIQIVVGSCRNVEPVLEDALFETWRVTAGEYRNVTALKDAMAPLAWTGVDYLDDLAALKAADIPPGYFAKASTIGRVRSNRGGLAFGRVTADVEGSTLFGAYSDRTADILAWAARGPAGLPLELVNQGSYGALPDDPVGFVAYGEETVEDVYNALLKPYNGHFGPDRNGRLSVGVVNADLLDAPEYALEEEDWIGGEPDPADQPPRWAQSVTWNRNWTVMTAAELVDPDLNPEVTADDIAFAQRESDVARAEDSAVLQQFRLGGVVDGDDVYGPVPGFFATEQGARRAARSLLGWLKLRKRRFSPESGFNFIFARTGRPGRLAYPDMGLEGARAFIADERTIRSGERRVRLSGLIAYA